MTRKYTIHVASGKGVAERWGDTYHDAGGWRRVSSGNSKDIHDRLCDLGPTPNPEDVAKAIGNKSWTHLNCAGCGYVTRAVNVAAEHASDTVYMCRDCLKEALRVIEEKS